MTNQALALLREMTGNPTAEFHDGQLDAISQLVEYQSKLLVVQKTGWGKVQFILLRRNYCVCKEKALRLLFHL
jgi:hypothetical protein